MTKTMTYNWHKWSTRQGHETLGSWGKRSRLHNAEVDNEDLFHRDISRNIYKFFLTKPGRHILWQMPTVSWQLRCKRSKVKITWGQRSKSDEVKSKDHTRSKIKITRGQRSRSQEVKGQEDTRPKTDCEAWRTGGISLDTLTFQLRCEKLFLLTSAL